MAAPVLGGLLIADEVIDVFLPVLYFAVQKTPLGQGPRRVVLGQARTALRVLPDDVTAARLR